MLRSLGGEGRIVSPEIGKEVEGSVSGAAYRTGVGMRIIDGNWSRSSAVNLSNFMMHMTNWAFAFIRLPLTMAFFQLPLTISMKWSTHCRNNIVIHHCLFCRTGLPL